jgi:cephalosporin hydroxylase
MPTHEPSRSGERRPATSSHILKRALKLFVQEGLRGALPRTASALGSIRRAHQFARGLTRLPEQASVASLMDFCYGQANRPWQIRSELEQLARMVSELRPQTLVEIGTARGGTLFVWARLADPSATIISVDLPGGLFGGQYPLWLESLYHRFALQDQTIHLIRADSHKRETAEYVRHVLSGRSIDFLFIDGDHAYDGVRLDFELYSPLVRRGGIAALHDVVEGRDASGCEVPKFWNEIKGFYAYKELVEDPLQGRAGIGVLRP